EVEQSEAGSRHRMFAELGLACLKWWDDQPAEALPHLRNIFELAGHRPALQVAIVKLHQTQKDDAVALELLDRIKTTDGELIKEIELRALDLAAKLKNTDRAREAAERLFGVKLEPAEELGLAKQLSELGMQEQSQALLARAPQRHANDVGMLLQIMKQHENQKNLDEACQIAEQIIRRTQPIATAKTLAAAQAAGTVQSTRVGGGSEDARLKALGLLASAGRLTSLIEQSEQQFDSSPNSLRVFAQLMELYSAASAAAPLSARADYTDAQKTLLARVAKTESADPLFRLQVARSLVAAGDAKDAVPHYLFVLEKSPNATAQVLFEAENIIQELGNAEDLARVVLRSKVAANDSQRIELFARLIARLEGPPIKGRLIIELFQKAWRESPDFRPQLAQRLLAVSPSVWQQEEMWDLAREFVLPASDRQAVATWSGVDVMRLSNGRDIEGLMLRLLDLAQEQKKLDELARDTEASLKKHPGWLGGRALLGMIRLRQGDPKQARTTLADLLKEGLSPPLYRPQSPAIGYKIVQQKEGSSPLLLLSLVIGYEVARQKELVDVAMKFYEPAMSATMSWEIRRVVLEHCRVHGKIPEFQQMAIDILLSLLPSDEVGEQDNQSISNTLSEVSTIAKDLNQPYIAARLAQTLRIRGQRPNSNAGSVTWLKQFEERFAQACVAIKPDMLPMIFRLAAHERPARGSSRQRLDLLLQVTGESVAEMQLHSPILASLKAAATDDKLWPEVVDALNRLREEFPDDLSIAIAAAQAEVSSPKRPKELKSVRALVELAAKQSGDAKPFALVDPHLALWIVARELAAVGHVSN
ncbi:MAG TPA: tetratricopeptide repeat protein, partial [Planctomycetaceae bacterium]|nr:tetratricopeptide repeat protein [Planctomycetaceae bacterium]